MYSAHSLGSVYYFNCSWSDTAPIPPKRILNLELSHLSKCTEFLLYILENMDLLKILGLTGPCTEEA